MPKRRPADDRRIYCRPTATGRCPGSHRWAACRSSSGHRPKILSSAERIGRSPNSRPAVAGRRPLHDFYDMVQGRENPAMICRCKKVGIGEKSADHRRIYNPCDVPLTNASELSTAGFKHNLYQRQIRGCLYLLTTCVCCLCTCTCIDGNYREVLHIYALAVNIL